MVYRTSAFYISAGLLLATLAACSGAPSGNGQPSQAAYSGTPSGITPAPYLPPGSHFPTMTFGDGGG